MKKVIYISGKITGFDKEVYEKNFNDAEDRMRTMYPDATIYNPIKVTSHLNPALHTWEQYMLTNIEVIFKCNTIYVLNNWQSSKGAKVETAIAEELDFEFIWQD
jgi:hypothetical protein